MRPKSSLGQHFLKSQGIVDRIVRFAGVGGEDTVLEIGPGTGVLTSKLIAYAGRVVAVEKDDELSGSLPGKLGDPPNLTVLHGDILELRMDHLVSPGMKVVANLPYNIASQIILRLAEVSDQLSAVVVMVQKEVGLRICARTGDKDYSALTVILSSRFRCTPGFLVGPKNFFPEPKVDSLVIKLVPREDALPAAVYGDYQKVAFAAFGMRRKMLRNSLLGLPGITKDLLPELARLAEVSLDDRPQALSIEAFTRLARAYRQIINASQSRPGTCL
jgi:16S rRNA (adenine1518-N6/adenine1519-N6)-dimethyltransferase